MDATKRLLSNPRGENVSLMPKAFDILRYLVVHSQRTVEKDELMKAVWPDTIVEENNLTQNISGLRRALGEKHKENRFIATVPGRGYKFVAHVDHEIVQAANGAVLPIVDSAESSELIRRSKIIVPIAILVVVAASVGLLLWKGWPTDTSTDVRSMAVLPFKPITNENHDESLEFGMADALIAKLGSDEKVVVRPLSSVRRFASIDQDPVEAGRALRVDAVIDGNIQIVNDRMRVSVRLIRVSDSRQLWSGQFDENLTDIFRVQDSISQRVASTLNIKTRPPAERIPTESIEAYQLYMRGNLHSSRLIGSEVEKGIAYYERALELDPNFALVYASLAESYRALVLSNDYPAQEYMSKSNSAAVKAVGLDNSHPLTWTAMASSQFWYEWDWAAAETSYRRALELDPFDTRTHLFYAHLLSNLGRADEALEEVVKARQREPANPMVNAIEGQVLFYAGRYGESEAVLKQAVDMEPNFWLGHLFLSKTLLKSGKFEEAIESADRAAQLSGGNSEALATSALAWVSLGNADRARDIHTQLLDRVKSHHVRSYALAQTYLSVNDRNGALAQLEKAYREKDPLMVFLKVEPKWDELRADARFNELLTKMNF